MNEILRLLNLPAARTSDVLKIDSIGPVQYGVGFLALLISCLLALFLFSAWSKRRQSIFLVGSLVAGLGGVILAATSALYRTPWFYVALCALIIGDILWHVSRRAKAGKLLLTWTACTIVLCLGVSVAVGGSALYMHRTADREVSARLSDGESKVTTLKNDTLAQVRGLANESSLLATLGTPATTIALRQDHVIDFLVIRGFDGTTKASTVSAPSFTNYPAPGSATIAQPVRGTAAVVAVQQLGADTLVGGTYLGDSELRSLGFWGVSMTGTGVQATGTVSAQELAVASSADIRSAFSDGTPKKVIAEAPGGRTYLAATSIGKDVPLLVAVRDDAGERTRRKNGVLGAALAGLLVAAVAALIRRKRPIAEIKGIAYGGVLLAAIAAYTAWTSSLVVAAMGSAYERIAVDPAHPALTAHIYIQRADAGAAIVLDTAGANVASASFKIAVPSGVTAADVAPNQAFCVTISQKPQIANGVLTFSCVTADPATRSQLANVATVTLRGGNAYTSLTAIGGEALARRGSGRTENLPLR